LIAVFASTGDPGPCAPTPSSDIGEHRRAIESATS
jgi:hypothetical protein